jgi:hypothetical protein
MSDFNDAMASGWDIFDADSTGYLEIEACSDAGLFRTDAEAFEHVINTPNAAAHCILRLLNDINSRPGVIIPRGRSHPQTLADYAP